MYNSTTYHESTENDIYESHNIDSPMFQINDNYDNNEEPNNSNMNSENNQERQLAIYSSSLTQRPRLSQSQRNQLSSEACNTWNSFNNAEKNCHTSLPPL